MRTVSIIMAVFFYTVCFAQHEGFIALRDAKFSTGNETAWVSAGFDDAGWKTIKTGEVWQEQGYPDYHGYAWYRIHVVIPSSLKQKAVWKDSLRLFLAHINDVDETYLNGIKIGKTGTFPDDKNGYVSKWPALRDYRIPTSSPAIHWDEENVMAIKVYDGGGTGGIFMGSLYIDMLEKTDGLAISIAQDSIQYKAMQSTVPVILQNKFNTSFQGTLTITVTDAAVQKIITTKQYNLSVQPYQKKSFSFPVPNRSGIEFSYSFTQKESTLNLNHRQTIPYLLTPVPLFQPRIHSAAVVGIHPRTPFLFRIAASGEKPLLHSVSGLPAGLQWNDKTGMITGSLADSGTYKVNVTVSNKNGKVQQVLIIKCGSKLALTPPMGWNSWNCWGTNVSADKVRRSAQALLDEGLADYGWSYINIDDGWQQPQRGGDSSILPNEKFPDMKALGDSIHSKGLLFGIYSSPGPLTCGGFLGSYQNEAKDAKTYANWGVDYLKYDWCSYDGVVKNDTSFAAYTKPFHLMDSCLANTGRSIVYNLCQYGMKDVWKWGNEVHAQSWRTTEDIEDTWQSLTNIGFAQAPLYPYARPGNWNDPDMMIVGQVGWGENLHPSRLTPDEQYTHVSLWCMLSAPLLIGCDLSKLDAFTMNLLTNSEVLAIDQDVWGKQAQRIDSNDSSQVWIKDLSDGSKAVALFNLSSSYRQVKVDWKVLGLKEKQTVRDLWRQKEIGTFKNSFSSWIAPHGVRLLKIKS